MSFGGKPVVPGSVDLGQVEEVKYLSQDVEKIVLDGNIIWEKVQLSIEEQAIALGATHKLLGGSYRGQTGNNSSDTWSSKYSFAEGYYKQAIYSTQNRTGHLYGLYSSWNDSYSSVKDGKFYQTESTGSGSIPAAPVYELVMRLDGSLPTGEEGYIDKSTYWIAKVEHQIDGNEPGGWANIHPTSSHWGDYFKNSKFSSSLFRKKPYDDLPYSSSHSLFTAHIARARATWGYASGTGPL